MYVSMEVYLHVEEKAKEKYEGAVSTSRVPSKLKTVTFVMGPIQIHYYHSNIAPAVLRNGFAD